MKDTGRRTSDNRRVVHLTGPNLPPGGLYRVTYGNGNQDSEPDDLSCCFDGERPGRLYGYFDTADEAARNGDAGLAVSVHCGLHCWGQEAGYTEL